MQLYKKLNLPNSLIKEIKDVTVNEMSRLTLSAAQIHFLTEPMYALNRYFVKNNINIPLIRSCILFHRPANFPQALHMDCNNNDPPQLINCGINIPIINCDDSYMEWYKGNYATKINAVTGTDGVVRKFINLDWKEHPTLIDRVIIDTPTLVKVNVPHKVTVINKTRSLITLRFQDNPTFDDISKLIV